MSRGFAARDGSAVKSYSTTLQRLRRQISLDYYTIPPATQARRECALFPSRAYYFLRLLLWDGCEGAFLSEHEQKTQFGSPGYCLYGRNKNKNPGDEVYRKEVVALDKCQTVTQFTLIL